jgi:glyoxylase I family protein
MLRTAGLHHLAIQATDVNRVATFYRDVLGLREIQRFHFDDGSLRSVWLATLPETGLPFLAIERLSEPLSKGTQGVSMLAFAIAATDRQRTVNRLVNAGHPLVRETPYTVYFNDPEGNLVGLSHYPDNV